VERVNPLIAGYCTYPFEAHISDMHMDNSQSMAEHLRQRGNVTDIEFVVVSRVPGLHSIPSIFHTLHFHDISYFPLEDASHSVAKAREPTIQELSLKPK
jgi:hypothetical protein